MITVKILVDNKEIESIDLHDGNNKGDLISKEKVKDIVRSGISTDTEADKEYVYGLIDSIPSADVRPNTHGHWKRRTYIGNHETVTMNVCSECGKEFGWDVETGIAISDNNFCPNCGANMREPKGEKGTE